MNVNKYTQSSGDDTRVDINDIVEIAYIHWKFREKSLVEIKEAIVYAGPFRGDILTYLAER